MHIKTVRPDPNPAIHPAETLSVAAVIALVPGWTDQTKGYRGGLISALTTVTQMAGLPADAMPLTPASLRQHVLNRPAAAWGVKKDSRGNIRSRLRFILRRLDLIEPAATPLSDEWHILLHRLEPLHRSGLIGFAGFCSTRAIVPAAVGCATLASFQAHLEARTLTPRPRKRVGDLRKSWNSACGRVAGWPVDKIPERPDPDQYVLPPAAFADSFLRDLAAFGQRLGGSILDQHSADLSSLAADLDGDDDPQPPRRARPARASTVALRLSHARWAASALVATGVPICDINSLASLFTPLTRAHAIIRFLYLRAGRQPSAAGMHVAEALRIAAKYYLNLPKDQVAWVTDWGKDVALSYQGMTEKNEKSIAAVMQPGCERRLIELPEAFMDAARQRLAANPAEAAGLALRALAIEILTTYPFRLANLLGLRFDRHLHRADPRGHVTGILISPAEVKNDQQIVLPISPRLGRFIEEWTTRFRGIIASPGCGYLFPGFATGNQPMTPQGLREAIKGAMAEYVGVVLTPHQFRHLAAERFLLAYPGHYEALRQLLGHKSVATTIRSYCRNEDKAAALRFDALITDRRTTLRRDPPAQGPGLPPRGPRQGRR